MRPDLTHQEVTLRGNHDRVSGELRDALIARLKVAGIIVDQCGFTHLAYAPEISEQCCVASRRRRWSRQELAWSKGQSGWSNLTLDQLSERKLIELDDERRAAMVSNLMIVLCGDRDAQPVANAGTLYQ